MKKNVRIERTLLEKILALLAIVGPLIALVGVWLFLR